MNVNARLRRHAVIIRLALPVMAIIGTVYGTSVASAGVLAQRQVTTTKSALLRDVQQNLLIFAVAAQKYTFENTGEAPWNQNESTTPVDYAPFLLYAGSAAPSQAASVCGFTPGSGTTVPGFQSAVSISGVVNGSQAANPVQWTAPARFLPSRWKPAFRGTYCAVVTLNQPAPQQASMVAYYVAANGGRSASLNLQIAPSDMGFQVSQHLAPLLPTHWKPVWKPMKSSDASVSTQKWVTP